MKATWNGALIATSDETIVIEGNHYFPLESVQEKHLVQSEYTTFCPWKGSAHYYSIIVDEELNENAAWYYAKPFEKAKQIQGYIAFWKGVEIVE